MIDARAAMLEAAQVMHQGACDDSEFEGFYGRPQLCVLKAGAAANFGDPAEFEAAWAEAEGMVDRIAVGLGHSEEDIRGWIEANTVVFLTLRDDTDRLLLAGLLRQMVLAPGAGGMTAVVAMVAPNLAWPDLNRIENLMAAVARESDAPALVLWSPDPLPHLASWTLTDFSGVPPFGGPALVRFVNEAG